MRIAIKTLGCKSNRYESDKVFDELRNTHDVFELNEGISTFTRIHSAKPDLLIVNTCTVTHVADNVKKERCKKLRDISNKLGLDFKKSLIGQEYEVIIESISDGIAKGFTKNYLPVQFNCSESIDMLNKKAKLKLEKILDNAVVEGILLQP